MEIWTGGEDREEEKHHSRTSWKSLEEGEDIQRQETEGDKYFTSLVIFAQGRLMKYM